MSRFIIILILCSWLSDLKPQQVWGTVIDATSGEGLIGATVKTNRQTVLTDTYGRFTVFTEDSLRAKVGLSISYLGYAAKDTIVASGTPIMIALTAGIDLPSIVISSKDKPRENGLSVLNIPVALLNRVPSIGGERDPIKALQLFPGVAAGVEGTADLHIRGGTPDQNLLLLDGATIYNANHLFGFLSPFQPAIVKDIKLFKGGFPVRYGSRLSGIIDVTTDEGNKKEWEREMTLGLVNSSFKVTGPLKKDRLSISIGARVSYLTLLTLLNPDSGVQSYWFYDINGKLNYKTDRSNLSVSVFSNYDKSGIRDDFLRTPSTNNIQYGNLTASMRWAYALSGQTTIVTTATQTDYEYNSSQELSEDDGTLIRRVTNSSSIREANAKIELRHTFSRYLTGSVGGAITERVIQPNEVRISDFSFFPRQDEEPSTDLAGFASLGLENWNKFSLNLGLRWQHYVLADGSAPKSFYEPRVKLGYSIDPQTDLFATYGHTSQNLHLVTSNLIGIPTNLWVTANEAAPPAMSRNSSFGITRKIASDIVTLEGYYKRSENIVDPLPGIGLFQISSRNWVDAVSTGGENVAYGAELWYELDRKDFFGWVSYTLSWNKIRYPDINEGEFYFRQFDRRHNLTLALGTELKKNWSVLANFVYRSGFRATLPVTAYYDDFTNTTIPVYQGRYGQKVKPHHRLDIGFEHTKKRANGRKRIIALGCYNAYARRNPTYVLAEGDINVGEELEVGVFARQFSLFNFIPYFSYSVNW